MNIQNKRLIAGLAAILAGAYTQLAIAADATGNASATVLAPLTITERALGGMDFGSVAGDATSATTVVLTFLGAASSADGAYVANDGQEGTFDVTGSGTLGYTISLPGAAVTLTSGGGDTVTVDNFIDSKGGTSSLVGGADSFTVGATLNLSAAQPAGAYTGTYTVTVDYQ